MTRCLGEKAFLMLSAGGGNTEQRLHVESCELCSERYGRVERELEQIASALREAPPAEGAMSRAIPTSYKAAPIVAALLFAGALIWGESRFLHANFSPLSGQPAVDDLSDLIKEASQALFPTEALGQAAVAPVSSDWLAVQDALGEHCSTDCQELLAGWIDGRQAPSGGE